MIFMSPAKTIPLSPAVRTARKCDLAQSLPVPMLRTEVPKVQKEQPDKGHLPEVVTKRAYFGSAWPMPIARRCSNKSRPLSLLKRQRSLSRSKRK